MVYRYKKKAYNKKRKVNYKKKNTIKSISKRLNKIQDAIEYKHADFLTNTTVTTTGAFHDVSSIQQGDLDQTRDGDKITISSIMVRGEITAGDIPYNNLRVVFVQFERASQIPDKNTIFETSATPDKPHLWFYNIDQFRMRKGMKILSDKIYKTKSYDGTNIQSLTFTKKIKKRINVQFYNSTVISGQQIYMFVASDSFLGPHPTITISTRVNYIDL